MSSLFINRPTDEHWLFVCLYFSEINHSGAECADQQIAADAAEDCRINHTIGKGITKNCLCKPNIGQNGLLSYENTKPLADILTWIYIFSIKSKEILVISKLIIMWLTDHRTGKIFIYKILFFLVIVRSYI